MRLLYIEGAGNGGEYHTMFKREGYTITKDYTEAQLVCFTGGADVNPSYYDQRILDGTYTDQGRDWFCFDVYSHCVKNKIPMVGICRGSQFLCVANGGSLWQDIDGHCGDHLVTTSDGEVFPVTSTHHQEMNPESLDNVVILATAMGSTYRTYANKDGIRTTIKAATPTVEAVWFKDTQSLGVQGHPEFRGAPKVFTKWFFTKLGEVLC